MYFKKRMKHIKKAHSDSEWRPTPKDWIKFSADTSINLSTIDYIFRDGTSNMVRTKNKESRRFLYSSG